MDYDNRDSTDTPDFTQLSRAEIFALKGKLKARKRAEQFRKRAYDRDRKWQAQADAEIAKQVMDRVALDDEREDTQSHPNL